MNRIKLLRTELNMRQVDLAKHLKVGQSTLSGWENGAYEVDNENLYKMADLFKCSIDYLLGRSNERNRPYYALDDKDEKDIAKDLERIMADLDSKEALAFHGEPLDDEDRELLRRSLENSLIIAKQMAKKKFTPKKYRN
ncbi:helix-turn-helix domain-containing protein [Cohnella cellulosilytica]|uniref:Helix-turn-helix domain-containing protein n=1 Tax=Cohnella cellulosilytica TaxID=986710 RepID=A0ABW2FK26_9BACL